MCRDFYQHYIMQCRTDRSFWRGVEQPPSWGAHRSCKKTSAQAKGSSFPACYGFLNRAWRVQMALGFDDPRVRVEITDGIKWVEEAAEGTYDAIIVDSSDPVGPAEVLFRRVRARRAKTLSHYANAIEPSVDTGVKERVRRAQQLRQDFMYRLGGRVPAPEKSPLGSSPSQVSMQSGCMLPPVWCF